MLEARVWTKESTTNSINYIVIYKIKVQMQILTSKYIVKDEP